MKICFYTPYPTESASNRYRVEQFIPYLKGNGFKCDLKPFMDSYYYKLLYKKGHIFKKVIYFLYYSLRRLCQLFTVPMYDAVFIHRSIYPFGDAFNEFIIKKIFRKPIIFDFDDAIYVNVKTKSNGWISWLKCNEKRTRHIVMLSDRVIVGNSYLASYVKQYNENVTIIPTVILLSKYAVKNDINRSDKNGCIYIGWIGSPGSTSYLNILKTVMNKITKKYNVKFILIGADKNQFNIDNPNVIIKEWKQATEMDDLESLDIGINPIIDDEFSRGKCGFKVIQYMAKGICAVSSPVGINSDIIDDGINGYLANNEDDWTEKLSILIESKELRDTFGKEGRRLVEKNFCVENTVPKFQAVIESVNKD